MFYKSVANAIAHSSIPWRTHYLWNHWFRCIFRKLKLETWFYANIEAWMRTSKERGSNPLKFEESYYPKFSTQSLRLFHFRQKFDYSCSYFVLNLLASFLHYHIFNVFTCSLRYNARPSQRFLELEFRRSVIFRFKDDAVASYWIIVVLCRKYFWLVQSRYLFSWRLSWVLNGTCSIPYYQNLRCGARRPFDRLVFAEYCCIAPFCFVFALPGAWINFPLRVRTWLCF